MEVSRAAFPQSRGSLVQSRPFPHDPVCSPALTHWQDSSSEDSPISLRIVFLACTQTPLLSLYVSDTCGNDPFVQGVFSHCGSGRPVPLSLTFDLLLAASSLSVGLEVVGISQLKTIVPSVQSTSHSHPGKERVTCASMSAVLVMAGVDLLATGA